METLDLAHELLNKAIGRASEAVAQLVSEAATEPLMKRSTEWKGTTGQWRRVGGFNLFLRDGDGVIMNGPRALQGQSMSNISADDFKAIPHVSKIYESQGSKAVPGDDVTEVSSGVGTATLTHAKGKAVVTKGFGSVTVRLYAGNAGKSYDPAGSKTFPQGEGKEVVAFESAKAWARTKLRGGLKRG